MPRDPQQIGRRNLDHEIPSRVNAEASDFFITINCERRGVDQLCQPHVNEALLASAHFYHERRKWIPFVFLLVPDHLHMIVAFGHDQNMPNVISSWKGYLAKQLGNVWQRGFFDQRLRQNESWEEKANYILDNPARAGLVAERSQWPHKLILDCQ